MAKTKRQDTQTPSPAVALAPSIPGLSFRPYRGKTDHPHILSVIEGSKDADGLERTDTLQDIEHRYQNLVNCDPFRDMYFVQVHDQVVGYSRVWWWRNISDDCIYQHQISLLPRWRQDVLLGLMLRRNERRLRQIAQTHQCDSDQVLAAWSSETRHGWQALLDEADYERMRYVFDMVRPNLDNVPHLPLPPGIEIRPVRPQHYRAVWDAACEAFRDERMYAKEYWSDQRFAVWQQKRTFDPSLWQVAWDGDQVVGMVLNVVDSKENEEYGRKRGYTEDICVRRPWRRQGIARSLLAHSLRLLKKLGMTEAALGVDTGNPSGASTLYQSMGYQVVRRFTMHQKPIGKSL